MDVHKGEGGPMWTGEGGRKPDFFCGRHKWMAPKQESGCDLWIRSVFSRTKDLPRHCERCSFSVFIRGIEYIIIHHNKCVLTTSAKYA